MQIFTIQDQDLGTHSILGSGCVFVMSSTADCQANFWIYINILF